MKIYNEAKTQEIKNPDLSLGKLVADKLFVAHHDAVPTVVGKTSEELAHEMQAQGAETFFNDARGLWYYVDQKFPNGGRSVKAIYPVQAVEAKNAWDEYEDIYVYVPYTDIELLENRKNEIRKKREEECFPIINRGTIWYDKLTDEQKIELSNWYDAWLNAPETLKVPEILTWLK